LENRRDHSDFPDRERHAVRPECRRGPGLGRRLDRPNLTGEVPGVKVALGQSLDAVTAAYPTGKPTVVSDKPALWLQNDGFYFSFTNDKSLDNIRFDAPFAGSIRKAN
jgi:hypothetical protein